MSDRIGLYPGEVFAGYTIEKELGVGGMGTVYRAREHDLPRSVALKLLHRDLTANDYVRSRFELEAAHAARLEHPNIVTVYRRGREADQLWIAMQLIDSTDAYEVVSQGPLQPGHALHVISETARALDYAHSSGVLHRDVKPANILLERSTPGRPGRVLLADFGIAKALAETAQLTQTGMLVASLQYASPEQFDNIELDARADVYSLGCTLFHLLTGQVPYPGSTLPQLWAGHVKAPIPKPSEVRPGLPQAFDPVIARAMAKHRDDRYPSCGEFAWAARAAFQGPPARTRPTVIDSGPQRKPSIPPERPTEPVAPPMEPDAVTVQEPLPFARPVRSAASPVKQGMEADRVFGWLAQAGLIVLGAFICAALVTTVFVYRTLSGEPAYVGYDVLWFHNTVNSSVANVAFCVLAAVGFVLVIASGALTRPRPLLAGRLARAGAGLAAFALITLRLAVHDGGGLSGKKLEMRDVALLGAVLLLVGCWRGLSPSKRTVRWLVLPGLAVVMIVAAVHLSRWYLLLLGEGGGGMIAGIALIAAGAAVEVRRRGVSSKPEPGLS